MKCEYCDNSVPENTSRCPSCGAIVQSWSPQKETNETVNTEPLVRQTIVTSSSSQITDPYFYVSKKSRVVYIVLAILLGEIGVHNFYAGYVGKGIAQLLVTTLSLGLLFWISWIWSVIEACVITHDARCVPFE